MRRERKSDECLGQSRSTIYDIRTVRGQEGRLSLPARQAIQPFKRQSVFLNAKTFEAWNRWPRRIFDLLELAESGGVPAPAAFVGPLLGELRNQRD